MIKRWFKFRMVDYSPNSVPDISLENTLRHQTNTKSKHERAKRVPHRKLNKDNKTRYSTDDMRLNSSSKRFVNSKVENEYIIQWNLYKQELSRSDIISVHRILTFLIRQIFRLISSLCSQES